MYKFILFSACLFCSINSHSLAAATLIQSNNSLHSTTNIYIQGDKARIELPYYNGFLIIDVAHKTMQAVLHGQKSVYDMSRFMQDSPGASEARYVDSYSQTLGLGPNILGFETEEYALFANNEYCGSTFISVNAIQKIGLKKFASAFAKINANIDSQIAKLTGSSNTQVASDCTLAQRKAGLSLRDIGFPLKNTNPSKHMISEITKIQKGVALPLNAFAIPSGYKVIQASDVMAHSSNHHYGLTAEMRLNILRDQQLKFNHHNPLKPTISQ